MNNDREIKNNLPQQENSSSDNAGNKEQNTKSFPDPTSIQKDGETASEAAENEQKFKEALTERD